MEDDNTITEKVTKYLNETPHQKRYNVKNICDDIGISDEYYSKNRQYLYNIINLYKSNYQNRQGLKSLNFHNWRGFLVAEKCLSRELALEDKQSGWKATTAKNHMITFKNALGRLEWHENGRINVWIKKPVTDGKKLQILSDAFFRNGLIYDIKTFEQWAHTLKMKGVHCAIDTGEKLPYMKFDGFKESNGTVVLLGDRSHPTSVELVINYPDWAERNENALANNTAMINSLSSMIAGFAKKEEVFMAQQQQVAELLGGSTVAKPLAEVRGLYQ